jgi:tRNA (guanosine-2'-O-)-methyltransferase
VDTLKNKGYQIIATTPHDDCVMEDFDISKPSLFLGRNATACRKKFYSVLMVFLKFRW